MSRAASRAGNTVRPAERDHEGFAVLIVAEVLNGFLESLRRLHELIMPEKAWSVKYIFTKVWLDFPQGGAIRTPLKN